MCFQSLHITARRKLAKKAERARYAPFMAGGSPHAGLPIGFAEFDAAGLQEPGAMHAMQARCLSLRPLLSAVARGLLPGAKFRTSRRAPAAGRVRARTLIWPVRLAADARVDWCKSHPSILLPGACTCAGLAGRRVGMVQASAGMCRIGIPLLQSCTCTRAPISRGGML